MSNAQDISQKIDALRDQLKSVHRVKGRDLAQSLTRARRLIPRSVRQAGARLVAAEPLLGHPKLERQLDFDALNAACEEMRKHLAAVDVADLRKGRLLSLAGVIAFNILAVAGLFITWMVWSGQV